MTATIPFDVHNRWTGEVQFTAQIACAPDERPSVKLGLAVRWAVKNGADLTRAYLAGANLTGADLGGANLTRANLTGANLTGAYLAGADLTGAYLAGANLSRAALGGANLTRADLLCAGDRRCIKTLQLDTWAIAYTADTMQIGCQRHPIAAWWEFTDAEIAAMDPMALDWWRVWKPVLRKIIETSPAEPTGYVATPAKDTPEGRGQKEGR